MTHNQINSQMKSAIRNERLSTTEVLKLINLADKHKTHLEMGFSSLFDWLTKEHGYSESAAQRRIQAARLMRSVPQISEKLESGETNLTNIARVQSVIRAQEKMGPKLSDQMKTSVVEEIQNKSSIEADRTLMTLFPDVASTVQLERKTVIDDHTTRLALNFSNEEIKNLERVRDLLSHTIPNASMSDVIAYLSKDFLSRKDPLIKKDPLKQDCTLKMESGENTSIVPNTSKDAASAASATSAAAKQCVTKSKSKTPVPRPVRRVTIQKANGRCEYKDPQSGKICGSTYQLETDHVIPRAKGGTNDESNLRCLCRSHNQLMAEKLLGKKNANRWREAT